MNNETSHILSPTEIVESNIKLEVNRSNMPLLKMVLLGILAVYLFRVEHRQVM